MSTTNSRNISAFMHISLDGYYCDVNGDMRFAHKAPDDAEWNEFVAGNASGGGMLLFGRRTYDMMKAWWPTPMAAQAMPEVAARMNRMPKAVFSRTLGASDWSNTTVVNDDPVKAVLHMKAEAGPAMTILGSGTIVTQLAEAGLIDTFQIVVNPIALGAGRSLFGGLKERLNLTLTQSRAFNNGAVVLWYLPR